MRAALPVLFLTLLGISASAQQPPSSNQPTSPIYFVVDASGSMKGDNQKEAEDLLRGLSLPSNQLVSVTYFGGKPNAQGADLCVEEIAPPTPELRGVDFSPKFPELGGSEDKTAIANAMDSVLRAVGDNAKLILITDGIEECDTNFGAIRTRYPDAQIQVRQVGKNPNRALQLLEINPRVAEPSASAAPTASSPPTTFGKQTDSDLFRLENWLWLITIGVFVLSALFFGFHYGRAASRVESKIKELDAPKKPEADKK
jgi:hypothetical protein